MKKRNVYSTVACFFMVFISNMSRVWAVEDTIDGIITTEQAKIDYVVFQLGLFSHKQYSSSRKLIELLYEYRALVSVGAGIPAGMLAGYFTNWCITASGYVENNNNHTYYGTDGSKISRLIKSLDSAGDDICMTSSLLVPLLIYTVITWCYKKIASDAYFYRNRLETFLKNWHKHKHSTPGVLIDLFQELYEHYLVYGHRLLFNDVLIQGILRRVVHVAVLDTMPAIIEESCNYTSVDRAEKVYTRPHRVAGYANTSVR